MASFDTKRIRAGYTSKEHNYSVNVPIYQTASFDLDSVERAKRLWTFEESGPLYTRVGNPTVTVLEERLKELDGAAGALALASGMAAISYTFLVLGEGGGNIITASSLYGGTEDAMSHFYPKFGVTFKFVQDRFDVKAYEEQIDENTKAIFIETISNPNAELYDIEEIAKLAHKYDIPLVVDNTVATPYLLNPIEHGADIVIYSATKGLSGHGNTIAGVVLENGTFEYKEYKFPQFYQKSYKIKDRHGNRRSVIEIAPNTPITITMRAFYLEFLGAALGPFDAYLVLQGLSTISERIAKQITTTEKIVTFLEKREEVLWVKHPSAENSPFKELARKYYSKGAGSLLSFGFDGTQEQLSEFFEALDFFSYHVNIGDVRSLIVNSPTTTHAELDAKHLERAGISSDTVRISVGLEDVDDLIGDLEQAFNKVFK